MGSLFKRTERRPVPRAAEIVEKDGRRFARWKLRGKALTLPIDTADDGTETVVVRSGVYVAKFRDHTGRVVERSTGCRDESTARQKLTAWEREVEQIRAGVLDATALDTARAAAGPLAPLLASYEQSLIARDVGKMHRTNALSALRRLAAEIPLRSVRDLRREIVEPWLCNAIAGGMKARARNYYRDFCVTFANWLVENGKLREHDLDRLPKADPKADPVRPRRAMTEGEFVKLLDVARSRPLEFRQRLRKGQTGELPADVVKRLEELGRERVLIYRTFLLTGLRLNELRTLTVGNLDLTPSAEAIRLERKNEKNRNGSTLPVRADLADELRQWVADKGLTPADRLFAVPKKLRTILYRDLAAAGIARKDERGRVLDVHALRVSFATHLSAGGVAPRVAMAAMRHSDLRLTMTVYTDPALLGVRDALDKLPAFATTAPQPPTKAPPPPGTEGQKLASTGKMGGKAGSGVVGKELLETTGNGKEKPPMTTPVVTGGKANKSVSLMDATGFEPVTPTMSM